MDLVLDKLAGYALSKLLDWLEKYLKQRWGTRKKRDKRA
jgi:hypothetical protein